MNAGQRYRGSWKATTKPPHVVVVIPCHLESKAIALATVASVLDSSYPNERLHIFLSMDGEENQFLAREIAKGLGIAFQEGCCLPYADVWMNGIRLTISIFPHGGKPNCLASTVDFIQRNHKLYLESPTDTHMLMLDSDTVVSADMITLAASRLSAATKKGAPIIALSYLQGISSPETSLSHAFQQAEYLQHGILTEVAMASLGNVSCLSGTVVYVRLDALLAVVRHQTSTEMSLNEYWKERFGDDRCLTQRLTNDFGARLTDIQTDLVSEPQAATPIATLIEQRRRWLLGTIATEAAALCSSKA